MAASPFGRPTDCKYFSTFTGLTDFSREDGEKHKIITPEDRATQVGRNAIWLFVLPEKLLRDEDNNLFVSLNNIPFVRLIRRAFNDDEDKIVAVDKLANELAAVLKCLLREEERALRQK
eukprot:1741587-Rhodomonas_salina.1